ncbi:MAG: UDP-3-O-acyl-N-acetylglucosamine deacetylase, partial [Planctomycetota bacterium]
MNAHPEGLAALDDDDRQTTLARSFVLEGIGLHSGRRTRVRVAPAPVDHGLRIATGTRPPVRVSAWTVT